MRAGAGWVAVVLGGCFVVGRPPTSGEGGVLTFTDETGQPDDGFGTGGFSWGIAVGATVTIGVAPYNPVDGDLVAELVEGEAFRLVADRGPVVAVEAVAPGEARLQVTTPDGRVDVLPLAAEAITRVELVDSGFGLLVAPSPELAADGLAWLPGAPGRLAAYVYGDGGRLAGKLPLVWEADPVLGLAPEPSTVHRATFVADAAPGEVEVTAGYGSAWTLHQLAGDAPLTLTLVSPDAPAGPALDALDLQAGVQLLGLLPRDDLGRYVMAPPDGLTVEVLEGRPDLVTVEEMSSVFGGFSALFCPGEGRVRLRLAGGSLEVPVRAEMPASGDPCAP